MTHAAIGRIEQQLSIASIEETFVGLEAHDLIGCYKAPTGFYTISCPCGWRTDTGKNASNAHALIRAHYAGHRDRETRERG